MTVPTPMGFARTLIHREEVGSTNDVARALLEEGMAELPMVVVADRQTSGRGRESRTWWSDAGSLTFSVGLDPAAHGLQDSQAPRVALAVAVAVIEALEPAYMPAGTIGVRWPNDLEADGKKLAGILPEWVSSSGGRRVVIGIGLNVTTDLDVAPAAVREMATTIERLGHRTRADRETLLWEIIERLGPVLEALARDDSTLAARWAALDTLRGRHVRVDLGSRVVIGRGAGITETGGLRLRTEATDMAQAETIVLHGGRVLRDS